MKNAEKNKIPLLNLYGVQDIKAGRFFPPFTSENDQTSRRMFSQMCTDAGSLIARNPEDFRLFRLGDFDPNDGQIDPLLSPDHICDAVEFFKQESSVVN